MKDHICILWNPNICFKRLKLSLVTDYFAKHSDYTRKVSKILLNDMIKHLDIEKRLIGMSSVICNFSNSKASVIRILLS